MLLKSVIFCAILTGVIAGPAGGRGTSKCVSFCKESTKFGYQPETTYNYDYTTDISTSVIGGSSSESRIHLKARAEISAVTTCELVLQLRNVEIEESEPNRVGSRRPIDGSQALAQELTRLPLRFSFQDGKIEHICAPEQDPVWVLNIKRGILSTLQNTMENFNDEQSVNEVDVSGRCLTSYQPAENSWGDGVNVQKTKDLTGCSHRHSQITALQSIPYTSNSPMQSIPLLKGKQECTQMIRNRRVEKVQCQEVHKFQPFDREESGAQTVITQTLVFSSEGRRSMSGDDNTRMRKTSLLFQNQVPSEASESDIKHILFILEKLEQESVPEIRSEAPHHFIELVENLRVINHAALKALFRKTTSPVSKNYLLDAMPLVTSAPSLAFMRDLLFDGTLDDKHADTWLTSLAFIKNPTLDMISALTPLLNENPRNQALLGISSMLNSYCKTFTSCADETMIQTTLDKIFSYLGTDCGASQPEQLKRTIFALKAVGNAGRFPSVELEGQGRLTLTRCLSDRHNPAEIRLAAIDAFRRMPCRLYDRSQILSLFANMHEETEVRIKAYLISMKCADRQIIDIVKDTLYTDSVNQVGSFVWTHLTNLQETSSPDKQGVRELLSNDFLKNKFNTDARKYSRNYEGALYWEDWNLGGSSDANLIFTPDSFLPRSGMVNLTLHLFGESVNVLEFGARVKSLEQLLEPIFGPNGYFPDQTVNEALHSMRRSKRDVNNNQLERLGSIYDQAAKQQDSPKASIYTRIFGHEVMYKDFELSNKNNEPALVDEYGNDWMDLSSILKSLTTGNEIEYTKSTVLLDATYTVTTSAGIPLSLAVKSAATVGLVATGKIDLEKFWEKSILDIKGVLHPSAAVQVDGVLSTQLGTGSIRAGVTLQNTLLTSTLVQGEVIVKGSKVIHASLSVPQDKQEIFKASSQILILRPSGKEHAIEQGPSGVPKIQHKTCYPENSDILGVQLCGEINVPEYFTFPLATPAYVAVYLQKTDTFNSYEFDYRFNNDNSETSVNLIFDTPGSRIKRRLAANFQLDSFNGILDASIETPSTSLRAEGKYSSAQKTVQVTLSSFEEQILLVKAALRQQGHRVEPNLLVKLYNRPLVEIDGVVDLMNIRDDNGKANFNLIMKHLTQNPVRVNGELSRSGEKYETKLEIESYIITGNTRSQFRVRPGHFSTKSVTEYSWENSETKNIDLSAKVQISKKGQLTRFSSQFNFAMSDAPDKNLDISWETKKSNGFFENFMKVLFGKSSWTGHSLYNFQMSKLKQDLTIQLSLLAPRHNIDYNVDLTHKLNEQGMNCKFSGRTNPENEVRAEIEFLDESNGLVKKTLISKVNWPATEYSLRSELKELREQDFEWELIIVPNQSTDMKATVNYKNGSNNKKLDHVIEFRARGFTSIPISGNAAFSASDKQSHVSGQLEIEGNEEYSGRWSTSLDYEIMKSNNRKLEGKLTLNDKKYTGEVNYRKTKAGERTLNIDLNCGRHIAIETMLKGDLPGPFDFSVAYYPDKASSNKFGVEGTVDIRSINLNIDYFGQQVTAAGSYGQSKFELECQLWDNQRYAVSVEAPELTAHKFILSAKLVTPIDGFRDLTFAVQHVCGSGRLNFDVQGQLEQFATNFKLLGSTNRDECRLASSLDVTGMKSLEVFGRLVHTNQEKSVEVTTKHGEQQRAIKAVVNYLNHGGFSTKLETTGCNFMPELKLQLTHQFYRTLNTNLQIEWVMPGDFDRLQVQFQLMGQKQPYNYRFTLTSPWRKWNNLQGGIAYTNERNVKELIVSLDGNLHGIMPLSFTSRCTPGTNQNFQHETVLSWSKSNQKVKLSSRGQYISITNAAVTTKIELPGHHYQLIWKSGKDQKHQKFQADATYNRQHYGTGLSWAVEPSTKHVEASVWYQNQNHPRVYLEVEHLKQAGAFKIHAMALEGEQVVMKFTTELQTTGLRQWNFKTIVDSSMETLPTLRITSVHSIENEGGDIQHKSEFLLGKIAEMQKKFWDHSVNSENGVHKVMAHFSLQGGQKFDGLLGLNDDKIELEGELKRDERNGQKINLQLKSTKFSPVQVKGEWLNVHHHYKASVSTSSNGNNIFAIKTEAQRTNSQMTGKLEIDCSFGHHVLGSIVLNTEHNKLDIVIKEDKAQFIDLVVSAQVKPDKGFGKVTLQSEFFNLLLDPVHLEADYQFDNELKFAAKYQQVNDMKSIRGSGIWSDDKKKAQLAYKGERSGNFHLEINGMHKVESSLVIDNESIFDGKAEYFYEKADFAFGKHTIKILVKTGETYEIITTLGLDLNKFLFTSTTPIEGWTSLSLIGQMNFEDPTKSLTITGAREEEKYVLSAEGHVNQMDGKIVVQVQTPVQGYTNIKAQLGYKNKSKMSGELILNVDSQEFSLKGELSPTTVALQLKTPLENVRKANFVGQIDLAEMKKEIIIKAELNQNVYEAQGIFDMDKSANKGVAKLSYIFGQESYSGEVKYDLTQDYEANLAVSTSETQHNIGGRLAMNKHGIEIEAKTPFNGYEKIKGKATYVSKKSQNQHQAVLQWDLNGEAGQIKLDAAIEEGQVTVNVQSSITGFEKINAVAVYQPEGQEKLASIEGSIGESKPFKISVGSKIKGKLFQIESKSSASASITIEIQIPLEEPENLNLNAEYQRQPSHRHSLTISAQKNEEILTGSLSGQLTNDDSTFQIKIKSDLSAPAFGVDKFDGSSTIRRQTNNNGLSSFIAEADLNGEKHKIEATFQVTQVSLDLQVKSTFKELRNFGIGGNFDVNTGRFQAILQLNDQQTTLQGQYLFNGSRNSKINIQFTSPIDGLKTIQADAELRVQSSGSLLAALTFQNERVRCGAKLEGTYENRRTLYAYLPESTDLKLTLTSPIGDYENVVTSLKYSLRHQSRIQLSVLRNTMEEIKGEFALNQGEFKLNLLSNLQIYPMNIKNVITWNTNPPVLNVNIAVEVGQAKYRGSLKANIQGLGGGQILVESSIQNWQQLSAQWKVQGDLTAGNAVGSFNLGPLIGQKYYRSTWRTTPDSNWESARLEIWMKSNENDKHEQGFSAQYSMTVGGKSVGSGKLTAALTYIIGRQKQQLTFSTSLKRSSQSSTLDIAIQTPFGMIEQASLNGKIVVGQEISLDLTASLNKEIHLQTNVIVSVNQLASKFKWSFIAPSVGQPFNLNAGYDLRPVEKYIELTFAQNEYQMNIRADATVPENSNEIELHMNVNSNVPLIQVSASGSLKAGYRIDSDETRHLSISVNSDNIGKWQVVGGLRLVAEDFYAKLHISSPRPDIVPNLKSEINYTGNLRQGISSQASILLDRYPELKAGFTVSKDKILASFNSGIRGFENLSLEAILESGSGYAHKKFLVDIKAMGERVTLEGRLNIPSRNSMAAQGSLQLESSWNMINNGNIQLNVQNDGNIQITGTWGDQQVAVRGRLNTEKNVPWWKSASTEFSFETNSEEQLRISSSHFIGDKEYSFNFTLGENHSIQSYLKFDENSEKILSTTVQWDPSQIIKVFAEAAAGRFTASVETPWSSAMQANAMYSLTSSEQTAKGHFIYGEQRSSLHAHARSINSGFESTLNVDVPALHQKLDANVIVKKVRENAFEGSVEMDMGDRRLAIRGEVTQNDKTVRGRKIVERIVKFSLNLPSQSYPNVNVEVTVQRPENSLASLQVEGAIHLPVGVSKIAFGYEIPMNNDQQVGVRAMIDSPLVSEKPLEFLFSTEIVTAKNLKIRFQYENNDVELSWDVTLPQLKIEAIAALPTLFPTHSPFTLNMDGSIDLPRQFLFKGSASCVKHSFGLDTSYVKIGNEINTRISIDAPTFLSGQHELRVKVEKNADSGRYLLDTTLVMGESTKTVGYQGELTFQEGSYSVSGKISGYYGNHFVQVGAKRIDQSWQVEVNGESITILKGKRFSTVGKFQPTERGFEVDIECQTRRSRHLGKIVFSVDSKRGQLTGRFESPTFKPMTTTVEWSIDDRAVRGKILALIEDQRHQVVVNLNMQDLAAQLFLESFLIPGNTFNLQTKTIVRSNDVEILGDARVNGAHWRLEGITRYNGPRDMEAKLEIRTPFEDWDRFTISGKFTTNELHAELYTPFKSFPNAMFAVSGIPLELDQLSFDNIQPLLIVGLPWVTYTTSATCKTPVKGNPGEFRISFEEKKPKHDEVIQKFEASLRVPSLEDISLRMTNPVKVHFEATIPGRRVRTVKWELGGRLQWKTWAELSALGELNGKKVEFVSEIRNEQGNRRLSIELSTPFKKYERFVASVRFENYQKIGSGQSIFVEFQQPHWDLPMKLEIDYHYRFNGLVDMDGEINVAAPRFFVDFPPLTLRGQSKVTEGIYNGLVQGSWGDNRPLLTVEAGMTPDRLYATIETMISPTVSQYKTKARFELSRQENDFGGQIEVEWEDEKIFLTELALSYPSEMLDAQINIKTPFEFLRSASAGLRLSPLGGKKETIIHKILNNLDINLGASYNDHKLIQIELVNMKEKRSLQIHNPLRPVSLTLTFEQVRGQKLRVITEVCWDLRKALESTVGFELFLIQTSVTRNTAVKIKAGSIGNLEVLASHVSTSTKLEQEGKIRWQSSSQPEIQELGYILNFNDVSTSRVHKKYDFIAQLDTPFRSVQVQADIATTDKEWDRFFQMKWDIKRDETKLIGFRCKSERVSAWKSESLKNTYTIIHSALPHGLTLVLERTNKNAAIQSAQVSIQVTPYPQDHLTFGMSKEQNANVDEQQSILFFVKHPATNLNAQVIARMSNTGAGLGLSYVDIRGEEYLAQATFSADDSNVLLEVTIGKELASIFRFELVRDESRTLMTVRSVDNMQTELSIYTDRPFLELITQYDSGKQHLTAGLLHKKEVSIKLWREEYGMNFQDLLVVLRLNTSQILSSKLIWRPELLDEAYEFGDRCNTLVQNGVVAVWTTVSNKMGDELQGRWDMLQPDVRQALETLGSFTVAEIEQIGQELSKIKQFLSHLHHNNCFYLKDLGRFFAVYIDGLQSTFDYARTIVGDARVSCVNFAREAVRLVNSCAGELEDLIIPLWTEAEKFVEKVWREQFKMLSEFVDLVQDSYDTLMDAVEGRIEELEKKILAVGFIRKAIRLYHDYTSWIQELPIQDYVDNFCDLTDEFVWQPLKLYYEPYYNAINNAIEEKNLLAILELPPLPYLRYVSNNVKVICGRVWDIIEAEQKIKFLVTKILQSLDNLVHRNIPAYTLIWDLDKGHIEYHQPLKILDWEDFTTLPKLRKTEADQHDINKMSDLYYEVVDTIRNVKPALDMNIRDILPPFGAHAVMAGDHHYYTFDKKYFRFAGECSYVLAADLLHKNFSLIVNYENRDGDIRKKSYTLVSGKNSVDIDTSNMKVTLDGRKVELPLEVGPTFIRRMSNGVEIFDTRGFQMTCNQSPAVCTLSISGWYFGKVAGLLGTYDNEEMNDMKTPDGQIVTDVANFAHSWRVGRNSGECRMKNLARDNAEMRDVDGTCSQIFDDKRSLLRPCFNRVDSTTFSEMCRYDTSHNLNKVSRTESACTAISAYVTECQKNGVDVWLPPTCIRCKLEDGTTLMSGENATLSANGDMKPQQSSDVVILLEEASCISPNSNSLTEVMRQLDNTLKAEGLQNNRYVLIGYAGQGPHRKPHIHTSSGQIWAHSTLFKVPDSIAMNGDGHGDLYEAIGYASSTLKFRAGVSKTIIAVTCGDENCGSESRYSDALTLLLENDFKLHLLTPKEFTLKGNKKDALTSKVLGIDVEGVYTSAHVRNPTLEADKSLRRQINLPKDLCTPLAIETNGTRFYLQRSTSKKSLDVWSRRVAKTSSPSECQHCECVPDKSGSPNIVCSQCISPRLKQLFLEWQKYQSINDGDEETIPIELINQL